MRVIAGQFRSRVLHAPKGMATRPTSDRLRETLFNVLGPRVQGVRFADLYAGSGAVGIEALSRGAASCLFAENSAPALSALRTNLASLKLERAATIEFRSVAAALQQSLQQAHPLDIVFLDPPWAAAEDYNATLNFLARHHTHLLAPDALVIAEHARQHTLAETFGALTRSRTLTQGDASLSFFRLEQTSSQLTAQDSPAHG